MSIQSRRSTVLKGALLVLVLFQTSVQAAVPAGTITSVIGRAAGDGYPSETAKLTPTGLAFDPSGNLFLVDRRSLRVRWIDRSTGSIEAGTGQIDLGSATINTLSGTSLGLVGASDVAVDGSGRVYIADQFGHRVWRRNTNGNWEAYAGTGVAGFAGDNQNAVSALLDTPTGIAIDSSGNVFISDTSNRRIRRVDASSNIITTVAGTIFDNQPLGDGGPASQAKLGSPRGLTFDLLGNLIIADSSNQRIRRVTAISGQINGSCTITTIAGNGILGGGGNGEPATAARINAPTDVATAPNGDIYIADTGNHLIRRVDSAGIIYAVAGTFKGSYGDGGAATAAGLDSPQAITFASTGDLWISDTGNERIRRVRSGIITSVIGDINGDGYPSEIANLTPTGMAFAANGDLFLIDRGSLQARWVDVSTGTADIGTATIHTVDPPAGFVGASDLAIDGSGRLYLVDQYGNRVWRRSGATWSVLAGTGVPGNSGDQGQGSNATINAPTGIAVDAVGNAYIADATSQRIRRVDGQSGVITTVAGSNNIDLGDGGRADQAKIASPRGLALDSLGNLYIAESGGHRIRKITAVAGQINGSCMITTVAGNGNFGGSGNGSPATSARLGQPADVWVDKDFNIFIADSGNSAIRWVEFTTSNIFTVAGSFKGLGGDGGPATSALMDSPQGVLLSADGDLWISDTGNERIRRVDLPGAVAPTATATNTLVPTSTPTPTRTLTRTPTPTNTIPINTPTSIPSGTPTLVATPTLTVPPSQTQTRTPSRTPTVTHTHTFTATPSATPSRSQTSTPTMTATASFSPTSAATSFNLSGYIRYSGSNIPVPSVTVRLVGRETLSALTDGNGFYDFGEVAAGTWQVIPEKLGDRQAALSSLDAVYIQQALAPTPSRTLGPDQRMAADANGSGSLDFEDATLLLRFKVGTLAALPLTQRCSSDWLFRPAGIVPSATALITNPVTGPSTCTPGSVTLSPINAVTTLDFSAVLIGDATGNWPASTANTATSRRSGSALERRGFR